MKGLDNRYFPLVLDAIEQGVFTVDSDTQITSFNRAAEVITGYRAEEAVGQQCADIFHTDLCHGICPLKQSIGTQEAVRGQRVRIRTRDQRFVPILISTSPLMTHGGELLGGVEIFRDISGLEALRREVDGRYQFEDIVSRNAEMQRIFDMLPLVAESRSTVLITGESGTGKELVARAIHSRSPRHDAPFVAFNCAAVPEGLLESELFGYRRGAFTDAHRDKPGRIAQADGGTLFLDEVGDLPQAIQVKLLRFLQDHCYEPLGSTNSISADVRIVAATHRDLRAAVLDGSFREDLYYRIHIVEVPLPSLASRTEDIPLLVRHFVGRFRSAMHKQIDSVTHAAMAVLMQYRWPGNIRELENAIEHAFVLCQAHQIGPEHLPPHIFQEPVTRLHQGVPQRADLHRLEREAILRALDRHGGNRSRAAQELGIHRTTLQRKLKRLGLI